MPYISYHITTPLQEQLQVTIRYKVHSEKGRTTYTGVVTCSSKQIPRNPAQTGCYSFTFTRDATWSVITNLGVYECKSSYGSDRFPGLQEVMHLVAVFERDNN
jgi:hypothetical protein